MEGPYSPPISELLVADHVLLLVGGTGITGAISIARWWISNFSGAISSARTLHLIWTVRDRGFARAQEVDDLKVIAERMANMTVDNHVSSEAGRLQPDIEIDRFMSSRQRGGERCWVYVSGPAGLMEDVETACVRYRKRLGSKKKRVCSPRLNWYIASYST